jgi:hypothetical protein
MTKESVIHQYQQSMALDRTMEPKIFEPFNTIHYIQQKREEDLNPEHDRMSASSVLLRIEQLQGLLYHVYLNNRSTVMVVRPIFSIAKAQSFGMTVSLQCLKPFFNSFASHMQHSLADTSPTFLLVCPDGRGSDRGLDGARQD